jgi:uncharacterized protein (UPF0216 family)
MEEVIFRELTKLNAHLPKKRISLKEALENPEIELADGGVHRFKSSELELLKTLLPEKDWESLKLPILIEMNPKFGKGAGKIRGLLECKVIAKLLGKRESEEMILYLPEIAELRAKLSTVTEYFFTA